MGAAVPGQALHAFGNVDDPFRFRVRVIHGPQLFCLQGPVQRNAQLPGHRFGDPVCFRQADTKGPAHVPHGSSCLQRTEGNDQGHMVRPVFADYVLQHFPTPAVTEVRINIGHADPFRIQEPFKEQVKIQGIDVGNVQQIGYNGTGSAAPARPYGNGIRVASCVGMAAAVMDKVPHNEEVCRVSHGFDDAQLVLQPFMNLFFFFATCFFR